MNNAKWPSFAIQGIILATITTFIIKGGGYINTWMFAALLAVLGLFSLQTTSTEFLYLYPVKLSDRSDASNCKTHILRITTMVAIVCLYMGIYHPNCKEKTLEPGVIDGYWATVVIAALVLRIIPLLFNFIKKRKNNQR